MSNWMDCPLPKVVVSFAGGDILTGLNLFGDKIGLSEEQKNTIQELRSRYWEKHHELSIDLQTIINEMRSILRKDMLTEVDLSSLITKVDEHTNIINKMETLWIDVVYKAFQLLQTSQVSTVRNLVDDRMEIFKENRFIGLI